MRSTLTLPDVVRHIAFRDYLIANQSVAAEYGALKSELAVTCNNDNDTYCDGKEEFVIHERESSCVAGLHTRRLIRAAYAAASL